MSVRPDSSGPVVLGEDGSVDIDPECKMVGNQIFTRRSDIEGVEVLERVFQLSRFLLGDGRVGRVSTVTQDVLPHLVGHLFGSNTERTGLCAPLLLVQQVGHGVVGHVDGGVGKRLDEELRVPWEF